MKPFPETWKTKIPLLSVLLLILTLVGDHIRPLPETTEPVPGHRHSHGAHSESGDALDKAFNKAPDPGSVPTDPERERRMGIFHFNEGNKFLRKDNWKEAVANYKMALAHDKTLSQVYINMSTAYLKGHQYAEAKQTLETLQAYAPDHPNRHYNLACYFSLTHQEAASLEALQKSLHLGYKNLNDVHTDPDLANLRQTPEFKQWVKSL